MRIEGMASMGECIYHIVIIYTGPRLLCVPHDAPAYTSSIANELICASSYNRIILSVLIVSLTYLRFVPELTLKTKIKLRIPRDRHA